MPNQSQFESSLDAAKLKQVIAATLADLTTYELVRISQSSLLRSVLSPFNTTHIEKLRVGVALMDRLNQESSQQKTLSQMIDCLRQDGIETTINFDIWNRPTNFIFTIGEHVYTSLQLGQEFNLYGLEQKGLICDLREPYIEQSPVNPSPLIQNLSRNYIRPVSSK